MDCQGASGAVYGTLQGGVRRLDEGETEGAASACPVAGGDCGAAVQDDGPHRSSPQLVEALWRSVPATIFVSVTMFSLVALVHGLHHLP